MTQLPQEGANRAEAAGLEELSFEEALERLEAIVGELESGDLPLARSLALYEEGVRLARRAQEELERVEGRLQVLLADGTTQPLPSLESPEGE
jgi:exodeoxyribonuclease VII small subunit